MGLVQYGNPTVLVVLFSLEVGKHRCPQTSIKHRCFGKELFNFL